MLVFAKQHVWHFIYGSTVGPEVEFRNWKYSQKCPEWPKML